MCIFLSLFCSFILFNYSIILLCINYLISLYMTQLASYRKIIPRTNFYPKSNLSKIAKIQFSPKGYQDVLKRIEYFALGDSFVNMFLHFQNAFFIKLKGKSIKGLAKADKIERQHIQKWIKALPKNVTVIFNFGQVDLNLIRYYKNAHGEIYPEQTFAEYINWISSLKRPTIIIGIFASPIQREHIVQTLVKYNTLQGVEPNQQAILKQHDRTEDIRKRWNQLIEQSCQKHKLGFINMFESHKKLDPRFIDQNPKTIHLGYLPCILQLQKHISGLKIDIKKSLQIQEEYVSEKTQRYYKNLQIIEQRKRLQSLQSQQTRTQNDSATDPEQQDLNEDNQNQEASQYASQYADNLSDNDQKSEINEDIQYQQEKQQNQRFIDLLGLQGIQTPDKLFQKIRSPQNSQILQKIVQRIIQLGVFWINYQRQDECMMNFFIENSLSLIKDIKQVQQQINSSSMPIQKIIRSQLHNQFQTNLHSDDPTRTIQDIVSLMIYIYQDQSDFNLSILTQKLIFIILKQILISLMRRILSNDYTKKNGMFADFNAYYNLVMSLKQKIKEIYLKKSKKNQINDIQFYANFINIILNKPRNQVQLQDKLNKFKTMLNEQYPYAIYSQRLLNEIQKIFDYESQIYKIQLIFNKDKRQSQLNLKAKNQKDMSTTLNQTYQNQVRLR